MKVLVTGGAGYIGAVTTRLLLEKNYQVAVIDNLENGHAISLPPEVKLYRGDISDKQLVTQALTEFHPEGIIHFAAFALVEESIKNPQKYYQNNVFGSHVLFSTAIEHQMKNLVFSSSCATYGVPLQTPIQESAPQSPINPYGETKLATEKMLNWYTTAYPIKAVCLRYFNVAGATLDGSLGEDHQPETHLIPNVLRALKNGQPIKIFGNDYSTPDGTCIRDFIHVVDLAEAHIQVLEALEKGAVLDFAYNIGTGTGSSNKQVVETAQKITALPAQISFEPRRSGDPAVLVADPTKIKTDLGFVPKYSDLETIIGSAWKWHNK